MPGTGDEEFRIAMPGGRAQGLRERALACLAGGLSLTAVGAGIAFSPGGNNVLASVFALAGIALVSAFGILWDMQYPTRVDRGPQRVRGLKHLGWMLLIVAVVLWRVGFFTR